MRTPAKTKTKARAANTYTGKEIFPDTELPNEPNDIIRFVVGHKDPRVTVASCRELAECTLRSSGFDPHDSASLVRLTDDCTLRAEIYESLRLIILHESLKCIGELRLKIVREETEAGGPVAGSENISRLKEREIENAWKIRELATKIKARIEAEEKARVGKKFLEGVSLREKQADDDGRAAYKKYLRPLVERDMEKKKHRTNSAFANDAAVYAKKHGAYLDGDTLLPLPYRDEHTLRDYVKDLREKIREEKRCNSLNQRDIAEKSALQK